MQSLHLNLMCFSDRPNRISCFTITFRSKKMPFARNYHGTVVHNLQQNDLLFRKKSDFFSIFLNFFTIFWMKSLRIEAKFCCFLARRTLIVNHMQ